MTRPSSAPIVALVGTAGLFVVACQDDYPCSLSICNVEDVACHADVFDAIACAREFHGEPPPVEVIGPVEYDERFVEEPQDATARLRDQQLTELRRTLQLETMVPPQHPRPIAFYSLDTEQVIVVTTAAFDEETRVFVLMQAFASAQQAEEIDLRYLLREQPTTDTTIAAAALVHGEAHFSANLGMQLRQTGVELDAALGFYSELRKQARMVASDWSISHSFAVEDFIYGHGGHMAAERWDAEGREGLSELLRTPPRSTFAILQREIPGLRPTDWPSPSFELEPPYEVFAVDTLGAWMFEIMLRRAEGQTGADIGYSSGVDEWHGDEALFIGGETPTDAALYWKLDLGPFAEEAGRLLETAAAELGLPWFLRVTGGSLILVATPDAAALPEWVVRLGL
jgi:hypothetical protein